MNANDELISHSGGSENLYKYNFGLVITEGALALAQQFECFWFLDIICSYQSQLLGEDFQSWKIIKHEGNKATVTCDDGNGNILKTQNIPFTDFKADEAVLWCVGKVILLPCEY